MELLPLTPKIQRKFPMTEPLGEPTGPVDLFGRGRNSAQALSIATRRAAGLDRRINAMTFAGLGQIPGDLDIPASQMAYPMMRAEALGQMSVPAGSLPPGITQDAFQTFRLPEVKEIIFKIDELVRPGAAATYSAAQLKQYADREMMALKAVNAAKIAAEKKRNMVLARKLNIQEDIHEILVYLLMNNLNLPPFDFNLDQFRQIVTALQEADRADAMAIYVQAEKNPAVADAIKRILSLTDPAVVANLKRSPSNLAAFVKDQSARLKGATARKSSPMCKIPASKKTLRQRIDCAANEYEEEVRGMIVYLANNNFQFPAGVNLELPQWLESKLEVLKTGPARSNLQGLGQIPQLLRAERLPLMLNPNLGLKVGLPGDINVPPSYLAVPQIRREANINMSPAEYARQFRLSMDHQANNKRLAGLGAGVAQPQQLQIPETGGSYDANAFSSNYVDRIKAAVRIDYGEQQYAGYANAARAAQYQSPAFVGATYNYPEAFMRRGISLAGGLGVAPGFSKLAKVKAGQGARALRQIGGGNSWEGLAQLAEIPEGGYLYIDNTDSKTFPAPQNSFGIKSYDVVKATVSKDGDPLTGYIIWQIVKHDGSTVPAVERVELPVAAVAAIGGLKAFLGNKPGVVEQIFIQLADPGVQGRLVGEISTLVGMWGSLKPVDRYNKIVDIFKGLGANVSPDVEILILGRRASEVPGAKTAENFSGSGVSGTNNPPGKKGVPSWVWWTVGGVGGAAVLGTILYFAFRKD